MSILIPERIKNWWSGVRAGAPQNPLIVLPVTFFFGGLGLTAWLLIRETRLFIMAGNDSALVFATYVLAFATFVLVVVTYLAARMQSRLPERDYESRVHYMRGELKQTVSDTGGRLFAIKAVFTSEIQDEPDAKNRVIQGLTSGLKKIHKRMQHDPSDQDEIDSLNDAIGKILTTMSGMQHPPSDNALRWYNEQGQTIARLCGEAEQQCDELEDKILSRQRGR
ncbi:MAG: hypothetical protein WDM91_15355 [Rhizomicrobium sp.]